MLARPDKRLTNVDPGILPNPRSHDVEVLSSLEWDLFASLLVEQVASFVTEVTIESHVGTSTDGQQGFVYISNLEDDALTLVRADGHHLTASFPKVRDVCAIGYFILDSLTG